MTRLVAGGWALGLVTPALLSGLSSARGSSWLSDLSDTQQHRTDRDREA